MKKINPIIIQILIMALIIFSIVVVESMYLSRIESKLFVLTWINNIAFLFQLYLIRRLVGTLINPIALFCVFLFLFSSGQLVLYSIYIEVEHFNIFDRLNNELLYNGVIFLIVGYSFFILGVTITQARKKTNKLTFDLKSTKNDITLKVGLIFLIIGFIPFFINLFHTLYIVTSMSYGSYYKEDVRLNSSLLGLGYYFITGLVLIIVGGSKRIKVLGVIVIVFISIIKILSGDRGDTIVYLFSAYMLYIYFVRKNSPSKLQTIALISIMMALVPVVGVLRGGGQDEGSILSILLENNIIVSTLANLGGTMWPLVKIIEVVPNIQDYIFGSSYLTSFLLILPGFLRIGPINELTSESLYSSPATWLMNQLNMSYGPGFTPFAEAYLNFGWYGALFLLLYGVLISKLLSNNFKSRELLSLGIGISILSFFFLAMSARGSFNITLAFYVRYVAIPIFILFMVKNRYKK